MTKQTYIEIKKLIEKIDNIVLEKYEWSDNIEEEELWLQISIKIHLLKRLISILYRRSKY